MPRRGGGAAAVAPGVDSDRRPIGYTTEDGPAAKWRLYTGPIRVDAPMTVRARAIRYGYKESLETRTVFTRD